MRACRLSMSDIIFPVALVVIVTGAVIVTVVVSVTQLLSLSQSLSVSWWRWLSVSVPHTFVVSQGCTSISAAWPSLLSVPPVFFSLPNLGNSDWSKPLDLLHLHCQSRHVCLANIFPAESESESLCCQSLCCQTCLIPSPSFHFEPFEAAQAV